MATRYIDVVLRARNAMGAALKSAQAQFSSWSNSVAGNIARAAAAYLSFRSVIALGKAAWAAFTESENAINRLNSVLETHGQNVASLSPLYQSFAKRMQDLTGKSDEATLGIIAQLTNYGVLQSQIPKATQMVIGLGKAFGIEEEAATKLTAQILQGNFALASKYVPAIKQATTDSEKLAAVMAAAEKGFAQQEAALNTVAGRWGELKERAGDALEEIGGGAAGVNTMADAIKILADRIKELIESGALNEFGKQVGGAIGVGSRAVGGAARAVGAAGRGAAVVGKAAADAPGALLGGFGSTAALFNAAMGLGKELDQEQTRNASAQIARLRAQRKAQEDLNAAARASAEAEKVAAAAREESGKRAQAVASGISSAQAMIQSAMAGMNRAFTEGLDAQIKALSEKEKAAQDAAAADAKAAGEQADRLQEVAAVEKDLLAKAQQKAALTVADFIQQKKTEDQNAKAQEAEAKRIESLNAKKGRGVKLGKRDQEFLQAVALRDKAAQDLKIQQAKADKAQGDMIKEQVRAREAAEASKKTLDDIKKQQAQLLVLK